MRRRTAHHLHWDVDRGKAANLEEGSIPINVSSCTYLPRSADILPKVADISWPAFCMYFNLFLFSAIFFLFSARTHFAPIIGLPSSISLPSSIVCGDVYFMAHAYNIRDSHLSACHHPSAVSLPVRDDIEALGLCWLLLLLG